MVIFPSFPFVSMELFLIHENEIFLNNADLFSFLFVKNKQTTRKLPESKFRFEIILKNSRLQCPAEREVPHPDMADVLQLTTLPLLKEGAKASKVKQDPLWT